MRMMEKKKEGIWIPVWLASAIVMVIMGLLLSGFSFITNLSDRLIKVEEMSKSIDNHMEEEREYRREYSKDMQEIKVSIGEMKSDVRILKQISIGK